MENDDIQEFYRLCEYYILHNIERSTGIPSNAKLQSTFRYLLIYINTNKNSKYILEEEKVKSIWQIKHMMTIISMRLWRGLKTIVD